METTIWGLGFRGYSPPKVDRIWLWVYGEKEKKMGTTILFRV